MRNTVRLCNTLWNTVRHSGVESSSVIADVMPHYWERQCIFVMLGWGDALENICLSQNDLPLSLSSDTFLRCYCSKDQVLACVECTFPNTFHFWPVGVSFWLTTTDAVVFVLCVVRCNKRLAKVRKNKFESNWIKELWPSTELRKRLWKTTFKPKYSIFKICLSWNHQWYVSR